jgi:hypothetical protein
MARKQKKKIVPRKKTPRVIRLAAAPCNDTLSNYVSEITVPYGNPQPRAACAVPSADEKGTAMNDAKNRFKADAEAYCNKGKCAEPSHTCTSKVTITQIVDEGIVETKDGELKRCALKFKITGTIECSCPGEA